VKTHRRFYGCPLHFDAGESSFLLAPRFAEARPRLANGAMHRYFVTRARAELGALGRLPPLLERARAEIAVRLARGVPVSLAGVAHSLGLGERTLRRKLAEQAVSFRGLVDELRMRDAETLLADRERSVSEVAELLGFSEVSAFSRAFRRTFGVGPAERRRRAG